MQIQYSEKFQEMFRKELLQLSLKQGMIKYNKALPNTVQKFVGNHIKIYKKRWNFRKASRGHWPGEKQDIRIGKSEKISKGNKLQSGRTVEENSD
jgi:hypothetical protein